MDKPTEKPDKHAKQAKLNENIPDSIREKFYITRQVDTSISILESPENDVVLESLLFLSKYADIKVSNLTYLQQKGITLRLLNLLDRNVCILRLALRLLSVLLENTPVICELDQDIYDDKILEIADLLVNHSDKLVKEFCINVCSKLAKSCRITCLVFKTDLIAPILNIIQNSNNSNLIISAMNFLDCILDSPAALGNLVAAPTFHVKAITARMNNDNEDVVEKAYQLIAKLTSKDIAAIQIMFKEERLMEKMMDVVMNPEQNNKHKIALQIMQNCENSEETSSYFIKSIQFLSFCLWVKSCDEEYLLQCADIFEKLSAIPSVKQTLYDLSVEESIMSFLRSADKSVLNKACKAITNMTVHKYCCEDMLTTELIKTLVDILKRKNDDVDRLNEVALETVFSFFSKTIKSISMLFSNDIVPILMKYFTKETGLSEQSSMRVAEMLYKYSMITEYQQTVIGEAFFDKLLALIKYDSDDLASLCLEIAIHFIGNKLFNALFVYINGPKMILEKLRKTSNTKLMKFLLLFIHNSVLVDEMAIQFIKSEMLPTLKNLPQSFLYKAPIVETIMNLAYNVHLPLKFHEMGKLNLTDKLGNKFYMTQGRLSGPLPFLDLLEAQKVCTIMTFYLVDYTFKVKDATEDKVKSPPKKQQPIELFFPDDPCSPMLSPYYGETPPDPYLPRYIKYIENTIPQGCTLEFKIQRLAMYVDEILCGPIEDDTVPGKMHNFNLHLQSLKVKLGTNLIPIGFLRIGGICERALLFKAIADRVNVPCSLEYRNKLYWNEVAILKRSERECFLQFYIVDLIGDVGALLAVGSKEANKYLKNSV